MKQHEGSHCVDRTHRYVVITQCHDANGGSYEISHPLDAYSAADAVAAVRVWLELRTVYQIGGMAPYAVEPRVRRVEPYDEAVHGQWFVEPGGPGRGMRW
jgi:hypothetical protein